MVTASRENRPSKHRQLHQFRPPMEIHRKNPSLSCSEKEACCPRSSSRVIVAGSRESPELSCLSRAQLHPVCCLYRWRSRLHLCVAQEATDGSQPGESMGQSLAPYWPNIELL